MPTDLWRAFLDEHNDYESWDHDFIPNPHSPGGKLHAFVKSGGADVVPRLVEMVGDTSSYRNLRYWGCVGFEWLGPAAGPEGAAALEKLIAAGGDLVDNAAVALEVVDATRLRAMGGYRNKKILDAVVRFHVEKGDPGKLVEFLEWIQAHETPELLTSALRDWTFRDHVVEKKPSLVVSFLRGLQKSRSADLRAAVSDLLTTAGAGESAEDTFLELAGKKDVSLFAIEKLACHPLSEVLLPALVERENIYLLAMLLERRRCAGLATNSAPLRAFIVEKLERPKREWRYEEHDVHSAALCAAECRDPELIESLVFAVNPKNGGYAWDPLVRACRSYGTKMLARLKQEQAVETDFERRERLGWMVKSMEQPPQPLAKRLESADSTFLRGRIETSVWGAFRAYSTILLMDDSAHAAFQIAWIDRAFGSEIVLSRVEWIRSLGFRDEALLDELSTPLKEPLNGSRTGWDPGEFQKNERDKAERALAAGLPSMAAQWCRDERERYLAAANALMERVRKAT